MIIFDVSKRETHHPNSNFKMLCRRLRALNKVQVNKESISSERLKGCNLLIIGSPQTPFTDDELRILKDYINDGGSLAAFSSDGEAQSPESNLNELLADFGITIDNATLVRAVYHKYLHPKHALIQNGIVQPEIGREKYTPLNTKNRGRNRQERQDKNQDDGMEQEPSTSLSFVYPNGTTLTAQSPAYTLLSSGSTSYPVDCPIAAAWESTNVSDKQGRVLAVGSCDVFADDWLEKEENSQLCDVLFRFLLRQDITFDPSMGRSDFEEKECVPDIASLSNMVKPCLQENEPLPQDYKSALCEDLFGVNNDHIPDVIDLYKRLNVPYEPLTLVQPHFECPHPPLRMATHPPRMIDPSPPALELFDLDECFSDVRVRLAQLTNRSSDDKDFDRYIQEVGWILGLDTHQGDTAVGADLSKQVLYLMGKKVRFVDPLFLFLWNVLGPGKVVHYIAFTPCPTHNFVLAIPVQNAKSV
mmetsp:Transcript_11683/g.25054  ORF Transcript_11683/g.25054 Transcript_11683/m.25054 type:complete len:472 (-) Transcript_11683:1374-2789(-)